MVNISAVIITFNEEKRIGRCIDSVRKVADEVVVVDSFSQDRTREICLAKGVTFVEHPFTGFTAQKKFSVTQAAHHYILALDADEYLSPELEQSILQIKSNWTADAYDFNRLNSYAGKWIKSSGWYPDRKIRLWDRRKGNWAGGKVHETVTMQSGAKKATLKGDLLHEAYQNASQLIRKMQLQYADLYAEEHAFRKTVTPFKIFYKTVAAFFKSYVLNGGIFDGYEGLLISGSNANGVFYKYAKLLERNRSLKLSLIITTNETAALQKIFQSLKTQTVLPDEVVTQKLTGEQRDVVKAYQESLAISFVQSDDDNMLSGATEEYVLWIEGPADLSEETIALHKQYARKDKALVDGRSKKGTMISFWRDEAGAGAPDTAKPWIEHLKQRSVSFYELKKGVWGYGVNRTSAPDIN
ncbi:glycosyltransferase family 2 protein [Chryseolinea soli]|uniref:Glycosyltransferase n=1 Tax=Chryseolinea soli TaxID=2321403 RepID=A0A385SKM2_9BACT|nr:glycosyltransferase [Chryseolinea soli]AYB31026.1 glycosyltransferase [Chryseolinea soli]